MASTNHHDLLPYCSHHHPSTAPTENHLQTHAARRRGTRSSADRSQEQQQLHPGIPSHYPRPGRSSPGSSWPSAATVQPRIRRPQSPADSRRHRGSPRPAARPLRRRPTAQPGPGRRRRRRRSGHRETRHDAASRPDDHPESREEHSFRGWRVRSHRGGRPVLPGWEQQSHYGEESLQGVISLMISFLCFERQR